MRRRRRKTFMRRLQTVRSFLRWERWDLLGEMIILMKVIMMMVMMIMIMMVVVMVVIGSMALIG